MRTFFPPTLSALQVCRDFELVFIRFLLKCSRYQKHKHGGLFYNTDGDGGGGITITKKTHCLAAVKGNPCIEAKKVFCSVL